MLSVELNEASNGSTRKLPKSVKFPMIKSTKLLLTFYSSYFQATLLITACCMLLTWLYGLEVFFILFLFKLTTLGLIYCFMNEYKKKEYYYYQNLGISKLFLWVGSLSLDLALFIVSILFALQIK